MTDDTKHDYTVRLIDGEFRMIGLKGSGEWNKLSEADYKRIFAPLHEKEGGKFKRHREKTGELNYSALQILRVLGRDGPKMTLGEITGATDRANGTVTSVMTKLTGLGMAKWLAKGVYQLTEMGADYLMDHPSKAPPVTPHTEAGPVGQPAQAAQTSNPWPLKPLGRTTSTSSREP